MFLLVIPDTNALYSDLFLEGPRIKTILAAEAMTGLRLMIPKIVVEELRHKVEERLQQNIKDVDNVRRELANLLGVGSFEVELNVYAEQCSAVMDRFEARIVELREQGRILEYPEASPVQLAGRSIYQQRPFLPKDRGMRDTIIWLTLTQYLAEHSAESLQVILVTKDGGFLDDKKVELHESLLEELRGAGIPEESVFVRKDLNSVITEFITDKLSKVDWVQMSLTNDPDKYFFDRRHSVDIPATEWLYAHSEIFDEASRMLAGPYLYTEFDVLQDVTLDGIQSAFQISSDLVVVNSTWTGEAAIQGFIGRGYYDPLDAQVEFLVTSLIEVKGDVLQTQFHEVIELHVESVSERDHYFANGLG